MYTPLMRMASVLKSAEAAKALLADMTSRNWEMDSKCVCVCVCVCACVCVRVCDVCTCAVINPLSYNTGVLSITCQH